jgi:hypothetical protein
MCGLRAIEDQTIAVIRAPRQFHKYLVGFQSKIHDREYPNWSRMPDGCKINSRRTRWLVWHLTTGTSADQTAESWGTKILTREVWEAQDCRSAGERAFRNKEDYVQIYTMPSTAIDEKWLRAS